MTTEAADAPTSSSGLSDRPAPGDPCPVCSEPDGALVDYQHNGILDCNLCCYDTSHLDSAGQP